MLLTKLYSYTVGCLRAFPCIVSLASLLFAVIFQNKVSLLFGIYFLILDILSGLFKGVVRSLYSFLGVETLPIIGAGKRPNGAKYCGCFIDENNLEGKSTSFGMPSGHSMLAIFTAVFWSLYILENYEDDYKRNISLLVLNVCCILVCLSRVYLNCHTIQQVIVGSIIGFILGNLGYKLYKKIINMD